MSRACLFELQLKSSSSQPGRIQIPGRPESVYRVFLYSAWPWLIVYKHTVFKNTIQYKRNVSRSERTCFGGIFPGAVPAGKYYTLLWQKPFFKKWMVCDGSAQIVDSFVVGRIAKVATVQSKLDKFHCGRRNMN